MRNIIIVVALCVTSTLMAFLFIHTDQTNLVRIHSARPFTIEQTTETSHAGATLTAIAWSDDGRLLASTSNFGNSVTVWDREWKPILKIENLQGPFLPNSLAFADHGRLLITGPHYDSPDRTAVSVWNIADGNRIVDLPAFGRPGHAASFSMSPDGKYLAIIFALYNSVVLYDVKSWALIGELATSNSAPGEIAFDPTGSRIAVGTYGGEVIIGGIFASDASIKFRPFGPDDNTVIGPLAFSPDGQSLLVTAGITVAANARPAAVQIFNVSSGQKVRELPVIDRPIKSAAWLSEGSLALVLDNAQKLHVWPAGDVGTETTVQMFGTDGGPLSPSPAGGGFAYGSGQRIATFRVHAGSE